MAKTSGKIDWDAVLAGTAIVIAAVAVYRNSFSAPFVFDADSAITNNPTIRHLWPIGSALHPPPGGSPVSGRPLVNVSLAINYAFGGMNVWGYHAFNLTIHILAGLTLYGVVRRTLCTTEKRLSGSNKSSQGRPRQIALMAAVLWTVHPLQTESVTYVVQRAESLMGLFYLVTLYAFIRGTEMESAFVGAKEREKAASRKSLAWLAVSWTACLFGMATKEVMATAPLMVFLYDRTFVSGKYRNAWSQHKRYYLGLACTWLLLAYLVIGTDARGGTVGFSTSVPWWGYALAQFKAIVHYLRLSFWPHPLVIDYGLRWGAAPIVLMVDGLIVVALGMATLVGIRRQSLLGFLGAWFFLILAPSSSVVPVATEIIAEHRMYLPLAAITVLAAWGLCQAPRKISWAAFIAIALGLSWVSVRRNRDYRSELALWSNTVEKVPDNAGAHNNLGQALVEAKDLQAATREFIIALRLEPRMAGARSNLGAVLLKEGRIEEAIANYKEAIQIYPDFAYIHTNLGRALTKIGRMQEAAAEFKEAVRLRPDDAVGHDELGFACDKVGQCLEAIAEYREALRLKPDYFDAHYNLANILAQNGALAEAIAEYEMALRLDPNHAEAQSNLGSALLQANRPSEAIAHFETAIRLKPDLVEAKMNLGSDLVETGKAQEAIAYYRAALRLKPDSGATHHDLGIALQILGQMEEARTQFREAERLGNEH